MIEVFTNSYYTWAHMYFPGHLFFRGIWTILNLRDNAGKNRLGQIQKLNSVKSNYFYGIYIKLYHIMSFDIVNLIFRINDI